jgi:hypothetical protein
MPESTAATGTTARLGHWPALHSWRASPVSTDHDMAATMARAATVRIGKAVAGERVDGRERVNRLAERSLD